MMQKEVRYNLLKRRTLNQMKSCISIFCLVILTFPTYLHAQTDVGKKQFKVLNVMSYHGSWEWAADQFNGFKHSLRDLDVEYNVFQMDSKRKSTKEWITSRGSEAGKLIKAWNPSLVYVNDDHAQEYVTRNYINSEIPFVFSGVNTNPFRYGIVGSENVTGIIEQERFVETIQLLREIVPKVRKIAVILDDGLTWEGVVARMMDKSKQISNFEISRWYIIKTFEQYQEKVMEKLQGEVDAVGLLGVFLFKDKKGENVPFEEVLQWTALNSKIPDFSFWKERIYYGTLCTVSVSGYEQGIQAGKMAREILLDRRSPSEIPIKTTLRGEPAVSLARAKSLGIRLKSSVLLTAEVVSRFNWEQ